jgi:t-SNARE complex subunit (syntaxin)
MSTPRSNINTGVITSRSSINSARKARKNNLKTYQNGPG